MTTVRKFSLFIALVLALGCGKKKSHPADEMIEPEPPIAQEIEGEEEGSLESRCFEGDAEACDELG